MRDSYEFYKEVEESPVEKGEYFKIIDGYLKMVMDKVFEGYMVKLGVNDSLGQIGIQGSKMNIRVDEDGNVLGAGIDYKRTNELWRSDPEAKRQKIRIYHFNEHSDGYRYSLIWHKAGVRVRTAPLYRLSFCRAARRRVSPNIKSGKEYYTK